MYLPASAPHGIIPNYEQKVILKCCCFCGFLALLLVSARAQNSGEGMRGVYLRFIPSSEGQRKLVAKLEGHVSTIG